MKHLRFARLSLRTQIALVFGALSVALAVVLSVLLGEVLKQQARHGAGLALQSVARNVAKTLADGLHQRSREVEVLASSAPLWSDGIDSDQVKELLDSGQAVQPFHSWIGVTDARGVVRAATGDLLLGQDVSARPWFSQGLQRVYVGDVHPAVMLASLLQPANKGEPLRFLDFAAPIRRNGEVVGVLCIHGSWDWAREVVEAMLPALAHEVEIEAFIFDRQGQLIYARDPERLGGQRLPSEAPLGDMTQRRHVAPAEVLAWDDQRRYLSAVVNVDARSLPTDLGWRVVVRQPTDTAFAQANTAVWLALALGLPLALLAALLAWVAARRLSRDLTLLATAALQVETGGTRDSFPRLSTSREVGWLSTALRRMTARLLSLNESMEAQVLQRTRELEAANLELDRQARSDPLTGLLNRRGFDAQMALTLALARRSGLPLSVALIDIDHFKRVNDTFGHDIGDEVIRLLARTLTQRLRDSDVIARLGGEEFVALLPDTDRAGARQIAETLVRAVATQHDAVWGRVTISIGVASLRDGEDGSAELMRRADEALYEAKGQGRNRVCLEDGPDA